MTAPVSAISSDLDLANFLTEHILDESLDPALIAILLSQAKNRIELEIKPEILIAEDSSQSRSSGDTYLTMKSLPDDFREMMELYVGTLPYFPVPFRKRTDFRFAGRRYYIDHKNSQFAICGTAGAGETIKQVYLIKTPDFTEDSVISDSATTCVWPKEHWPLIAWEAAEIASSSTDAAVDDLTFRMSAAQHEQHMRARHMFLNWDHDLKLASMGGRAGYADDGEDLSLEDDILPNM